MAPIDPVFHVALTADFYDERGQLKYADVGLDEFAADRRIRVTKFATHHSVFSDLRDVPVGESNAL